jgi:hypothetical protein
VLTTNQKRKKENIEGVRLNWKREKNRKDIRKKNREVTRMKNREDSRKRNREDTRRTVCR